MQTERLDPKTAARFARHEIHTDVRLYQHEFVVRMDGHSRALVHVDPHALSGFRIQGPDLCATLDLRKVPDTHWAVTSHGQRPAGKTVEVTVPEDSNDHAGYAAAVAVASHGG
jgi:citrate lyase beta subunit